MRRVQPIKLVLDVAAAGHLRYQGRRPVIAVQVIKRVRPVELDPVTELALAHSPLQLTHCFPERQGQHMPEPLFPALGYSFPGSLPLIFRTTAKMALSGPVFSVKAFS